VSQIARSLGHGDKDIVSSSILVVNELVAKDVMEQLGPLLQDTALSERSGGVPIPTVVNYLSQRFGILLAWLDAAIKSATDSEMERIQLAKDQWDGIAHLVAAGGLSRSRG
jgi:hypothetical protein